MVAAYKSIGAVATAGGAGTLSVPQPALAANDYAVLWVYIAQDQTAPTVAGYTLATKVSDGDAGCICVYWRFATGTVAAANISVTVGSAAAGKIVTATGAANAAPSFYGPNATTGQSYHQTPALTCGACLGIGFALIWSIRTNGSLSGQGTITSTNTSRAFDSLLGAYDLHTFTAAITSSAGGAIRGSFTGGAADAFSTIVLLPEPVATITGTLAADTPTIAVAAPAVGWSGSSLGSFVGSLDATTPTVDVTAPIVSWTGTVTDPGPSGWEAALAGAVAGIRLAKILAIGPSSMEGEGASARTNRYLDRFVTGARSRRGISGSGLGLTPAGRYATYLDVSAGWREPATGSWSTVPSFITQGDKGAQVGSGNYRQWSVNGDAADLVFAGQASGGDIVVSVDGTTVATVDANSGSAPGSMFHFALGAVGAHTVRAAASGGTIVLDGLVVYNGDHTAGVTYWDCSHTAYSTGDFTDDTDYQAGWGRFAPDLVIIDNPATNDFLNNTGTPAQAAARFTDIVDACQALTSDPTIVMLMYWDDLPDLQGSNSLGYTYAQYCAAAIAAANTAGITTVDLRAIYPTVPSGWNAEDGLHPGDTGHQKIADALLDSLVPATVTGTLAASTPAVTVDVPTVSWAGTTTAPQFTGVVDTTTPTIHVDVPTTDWSGTATIPAFTGVVAAATPIVSIAVPMPAWSGNATVPQYSGTLTADTPAVAIAPPTATWTGTAADPVFAGTLEAATPPVVVHPPVTSWTGTVTAPSGATLVAHTPPVMIPVPTVAWTGTYAPIRAGLLHAPTPAVVIGTPTAAWVGSVNDPHAVGIIDATLPTVTLTPPAIAWSGVQHPTPATTNYLGDMPVVLRLGDIPIHLG